MAEVEKDAVSGQETTGHEWDGIKELNTPLPRWWLYTFYACILFSVVYWILYPAWPGISGHTKGILGYSSRAEHALDLQAQAKSRAVWSDKMASMELDDIAADSQLLNVAMAGGKSIFAENCAPCHGAAGSGAPGYPVLADDDWIWGGTREDIQTTVLYGVRSEHDETRENVMPNFLEDEILEKGQINDVAEYVLSLSGAGSDAEAAKRGVEIFAEQCVACHGEDAKGVSEMGGPNLVDAITLYGVGKEGMVAQITKPRHGVMPPWEKRLGDVSIKQVSIYVHSLGGGK
jgi:cytochrome c oxidase cbb3-type subunit III